MWGNPCIEGGIIILRVDGREPFQLRPIHIETNYLMHPEGSVLISVGNTKVICTATIEDRVPHFMRGKEKAGLPQNILCSRGRPNQGIFENRQKERSQAGRWKFSG